MGQNKKGKSVDKKKVLPTKKFPELKLMINGEYRNGNNTLSSEDEMSLAVSHRSMLTFEQFPPIKKIQALKDSQHLPLNYQQQLQNMSHYSVGANSNMGVIGGHPSNMQLSYYGGGGLNQGKKIQTAFNCNLLLLNVVKKKGSNGPSGKQGVNGMLAALHPSGTIHVGGSNNLNSGMMNTDFKMTMKHNSSNHSI